MCCVNDIIDFSSKVYDFKVPITHFSLQNKQVK